MEENTSENLKNLELQASSHSLVLTQGFRSVEDYVLYLTHIKAYEEALKYSDSKTILDIGCNIGYGSNLLSKKATRVVGIDVSSKAISAAKDMYHSRNLCFHLVDGITLPFKDKSFKLLTCFQVIEHISDVPSFLNEIHRVLEEDGLVMLSTPNASIRLAPGMQPWNRFHVREWSAEEFSKMLDEYFGHVQVLGLFGRDDIYEIEYRRNIQERERHRKIQSNRYHPQRLLMEIAPDPLIDLLRLVVREIRSLFGSNKVGVEELSKYSTDDFIYLEENLSKSLNLFAVCTK
jgi:2-polyprenyl-3-methyl-5-hydroxy-6-metoxy-1,4-benzoquinol methylase